MKRIDTSLVIAALGLAACEPAEITEALQPDLMQTEMRTEAGRRPTAAPIIDELAALRIVIADAKARVLAAFETSQAEQLRAEMAELQDALAQREPKRVAAALRRADAALGLLEQQSGAIEGADLSALRLALDAAQSVEFALNRIEETHHQKPEQR